MRGLGSIRDALYVRSATSNFEAQAHGLKRLPERCKYRAYGCASWRGDRDVSASGSRCSRTFDCDGRRSRILHDLDDRQDLLVAQCKLLTKRRARLHLRKCRRGKEQSNETCKLFHRRHFLRIDAHEVNTAYCENVIFTEAAERSATPWKTASTLLPSGSVTNAA